MKCIIIDDEPLAQDILIGYCKDYGNIEIIGVYQNPIEAIPKINQGLIDVIFIDIEMPQISGVEFIKSLQHKPHFIFTTAYPEYALDGFELNAVDYLVKPIPFPRFVKAINRVQDLLELPVKKTLETKTEKNENPDRDYFFVRSEYENVKIIISNITHIEGLKDYLKIHTVHQKPILTLMSFTKIQQLLPQNKFLRVHKSYLVNTDHIQSLLKKRLVVNHQNIPIGEYYKKEVLKKLGL